MKIRLTQIQTQRQVLAPLIQQSIGILLLPLMELQQTVEQELQTNPLLEAVENDETPKQPTHESSLQSQLDHLTKNLENFTFHHQNFDDEVSEDKPLVQETTLEEYLMSQLRLEVSNELQLKIGELIIGNIDEDGFLKVTLEEIAQIAATTDLNLVEEVLTTIQYFEPVGIASRNLKECLLVQLKARNCNGELTSRFINDHLENLGKKRFSDIARELNISLAQVKEMAKAVSTLEPRPARNFRPIARNIYIQPDVCIQKDSAGRYQIAVNDEGLPQIRINPMYRNLLNQPNLKDDEREFIREKLENALYFIKSIEQRGQTIREITKFIIEKQKDFLDGNHFAITPMTLKDVATALDRNESTISRAINNKYINTPHGLFPLKYFFSQAVSTDTMPNTSAQGIKEEIKEIVINENKSSPLSDQEIKSHFERKGIRLARRTISKYRETLRIPPSYLRKNQN